MTFVAFHPSAINNVIVSIVIILCIISHHLSNARDQIISADQWESNWDLEESITPLPIRQDQIAKFKKDVETIVDRVWSENIYGQIDPFKEFYDSCKKIVPMNSDSLITCAASKPIEFEKHSLSSVGISNLLIKKLTEKIEYLDVGKHLYTISACQKVHNNYINIYTQSEYPEVKACSISHVAIAMKISIISGNNDNNSNSKNEGYMVVSPVDTKGLVIYIMNNRQNGLHTGPFKLFMQKRDIGWEQYINNEFIRYGGYMVFHVRNTSNYNPLGIIHSAVFYVKRPFRNYDLTRKYSLFDTNKYMYRFNTMGFGIARLDVNIDRDLDPNVKLTVGPSRGMQTIYTSPLKGLAYKPATAGVGDGIPAKFRDEDTQIVNDICTTCGDEIVPNKYTIYCETGKCITLKGIYDTETIMRLSEEEMSKGGLHGKLYGLQTIANDGDFIAAFIAVNIEEALVVLMTTKPGANNQEETPTPGGNASPEVPPVGDTLTEVTPEKDTMPEVAPERDTSTEVTPEKETIPEVAPERDTLTEVTPERDIIPEGTNRVVQKIKQFLTKPIIIAFIAGIIIGLFPISK